MPAGGGLHWDLRGLSVSSAWWAGCSSDAGAIGLGTLPGPEPGGERTLGTAGPSFLEESPEICRGSEALLGLPGTVGGWATLATKHAFREHLPLLPLGRGAHCDSVHTILFFFFFLLPKSRWPQEPWRSSPCGRKGGGAGKGRTKPRPRSPKRVSPGKNGVSVHPLEFSFHVFSFFFNPLKEARRLAK